ncbi:MAG: hypothetical protein Q7W30_00395 [Coriobacteriia bacterium]|nr:hypothetical protein [Coriobacteriia bacterium]
MSIDGRNLNQPPPPKRDGYDSLGVRIFAASLFWVPVLLLVAFAYWSGTWMGGWVGGVLNIVGTILTIFVLWLFRRRKH